jgi:hypothetical protein
MLKEILAVSGKPGLFKLVSRGKNLLIIEALTDGKRIPAYPRDKVISLGDVSVYTTDGDKPVSEILTAIQQKENGGKISLDLSKAQTNEIRAYFEEIVPNYDREKVYPTDIKKLLRWYELLIDNGITDFSKKEETKDEDVAETADSEDTATALAAEGKEKTTDRKTSLTTKRTVATNVAPAAAAVKQSKPAPKVKSTPKSGGMPKKNVVGAKRGS